MKRYLIGVVVQSFSLGVWAVFCQLGLTGFGIWEVSYEFCAIAFSLWSLESSWRNICEMESYG